MNSYLLFLIGFLLGSILLSVIYRFYISSNYIKKSIWSFDLNDYQNAQTQLKVLESQLKIQIDNFNQIQQQANKLNQENINFQKELFVCDMRFNSLNEKFIEQVQQIQNNQKLVLDFQNESLKFKKVQTENEFQIQNFIEKVEDYENQIQKHTNDLKQLVTKNQQLKEELIHSKIENKILNEKQYQLKREIEQIQEKSRLEFERVANQILEEKSKNFIQSNKVSIETLLKPLGENLENFKKQVEETYDKESKERFSLDVRIRELIKNTNKISNEANSLASALKGNNKTQGNWGEVILESILENSGLIQGLNYKIQNTIKDKEGKFLRPDVLMYLPDNRVIIIDSKVSLVDYDRFCSNENPENQKKSLQNHLRSITQHIDQLSEKKYDDLQTSLDFTIMFIPIEPAYLIAFQADKELWNYAYKKRVLLMSPTNLISGLKIISDLWKRDLQSKNAQAIVERGEKMYEKFVRFTETLLELGKNIQRTESSYCEVMNQLQSSKGNLINQAIQLKKLGLKSSKEISSQLYNSHDENSS